MDEPKNESKIEQKKKGRPPGITATPKPPAQMILEDDEEYITVKIPKKMLAKLLLKDLI